MAAPLAEPRRRAWAEVAYGLALAAAGLAIGGMTLGLKVAPLYAKVGPKAFPWAVAAALLLVGGVLAWRGWRQLAPAAGQRAPRDLPALLILGLGLLQQVLLVRWAGFVPCSAVLFLAVAVAFGRRRPLVDLAIGLALALAVYLVFTRLMGLTLPAGWLKGLV